MTRELIGIVFIVILGSALHFCFEASGGFWAVGIFAAMDESVWEHLKLAFWPSFLWMFLVLPRRRRSNTDFFLGQVVALAVPPVIIAAGYYMYTGMLGGHFLSIDIALFIVAVCLGQIGSTYICRLNRFYGRIEWVAICTVTALVISFATASFLPLNLPIFIDVSDHS